MPELMVCVLHVVAESFYKVPFIRRSLEEARDDRKAWHGFNLMQGVVVKEIGKGLFAQSFNDSGNLDELANTHDIILVGIYKGLYMNRVIQMPAKERERREIIIYRQTAVAA